MPREPADTTEKARLEALDRYGILDTLPEAGFDDIVALAAELCGTPVALVSLVAGDRQWFKARVGFDACETPLSQSVCAHALHRPGLLVIPDLREDGRTRGNALVTGEPHLRFYAGARLETPEGHALGMLCVIDIRPRPEGLTPGQATNLERLARQVMTQLELRRAVSERDVAARQVREADVRHRQVIDSASDYAIVTMDLGGGVTSWNAGAERILGWSEAEMLGRPADVFFTEADIASEVPEAEMRGAREHGRGNDERWHCRKDGSLFWASGEMMPLRDADEMQVGYVKFLRDRTVEHRAGLELREAHARLHRAQDAGGVGVFSVGIADGILHATPEFCRLYGLPEREEYPSEAFERLVVPEDAALVSTAGTRRGGNAPRDVEYRIRRGDTGALRWIARKGEIEFDNEGRPASFAGVARDITEQREAQEALRRGEERYRTLFEAIDAGFAIIEMRFEGERAVDYRFVETNPAFARQTGLVGAEGEWASVLVPNLERHWFDTYGQVARSGQPVRFESGSAAMDRWFDVHAFRIGDPAEARVALLFNDVSDRRRAEEALRVLNVTLENQVAERTRERNRLWDTTNDLMGTAGLDGYLKAVNPAWRRMLGWSDEELRSRPFLDLVDPDDHAETIDVVGRLSKGVTVTDFVDRVQARDGSQRTVMWTAVPEPDQGVFYIIGRDLTDQRRIEEQLRQSQKMEAVGQLTGGIAHDFNNLLTGISGSLELLQNRVSQGRLTEIDRYVNAAQGASKRAAALTHRLLAFSRRQTLDPKPTDVNRLIAGMEEMIRRTIGPEITLEVVTAMGIWPALVDPSQLENALLNLSINARDAMPEGGRITIETANKWLDRHGARERDLEPGQYLSVCVTDTGTGMTPDVISRAFEPFFTTKPIGQGTGLGLSMIYGFVRQSGGQVRIYSEIGQGTTMCLYLPRHYGEAEDREGEADLARAPRADQGQTVLIVDDEPTVRMLVTEVLEDLGYIAIEAADGAAGLKVLRSDVRIDLLVTDVGLPGGMNGRQMADAARVGRPGLKVLFITGYAENAVVGNGHLEPGMAVLTKPFVMEALATRIRELIADSRTV